MVPAPPGLQRGRAEGDIRSIGRGRQGLVGEHSMTKSVIVFGDSVTWGQGFFPDQKFAKHVTDALGVELRMHAHSGAVIGVNNHETGSCPPEAPRHTPTILQQIAVNSDDPDQAALVLLDGGINDISVQYILSPFTSDQGLKARVE